MASAYYPPAGPYAPVPPPAYYPYPPAGGGPSRLTIAGLVAALVAVGAVLVLTGALLSSGALFGGGGDDVLTGQVSGLGGRGQLSGTDLQSAVQTRVEDDGGDVTAMTCPATQKVAQNVATVCHGSIDGLEWAVVVFFEDAQGHYTLLLI